MAYVKPRLLGADNPYGAEHQRIRAQWVPIVAQGGVECRRVSNGTCVAPSPLIKRGEAWDLGDPDETCRAPRAPEHRRCNRRTMSGDRRAARQAPTPLRRSRRW